jgi:hypothetical protein
MQGTTPLLTLTPGSRFIDPTGIAVNLSSGGILTLPDGATIPMTTIGGGLRKKKVLFANVRVYVAQFLVSTSDVGKFVRDSNGTLDSTDSLAAVAMYLSFRRTVSSRQLTESLEAAMAVNGYNVSDSPDLQALSKVMLAADTIKAGSVGVLVAVHVDATHDLVLYQSPSGAISSIRGQAGLKRALMSAWFGRPADSGLRALRDEILGTPGGK